MPGLATVDYDYDSRGRVAAVTMDSGSEVRSTQFVYRERGMGAGQLARLTAIAPPGRPAYGYAGAGQLARLTAIAPPGRPAYGYAYDAEDRVTAEILPAIAGTEARTEYAYDRDGQLTGVRFAGGATSSLSYDAAGRLSRLRLDAGDYTYGYDPQTGQLDTLTAPGGEVLSLAFGGAPR